ncbi:hypothetical protein CAPTEDRAFT_201468 [Capitella teleta]|uniref:G-protein coupled receptors family 1 profile domain-containing protein n=1 Tax=Capitella teleta TaxID=283909 RepID=R7TWH4_CAPTE|nr:hypothetical protein CAPTEDRAFT_201468 [Capitella teleta]|eukprot:ELT95310.1 hypothetical protein CAPTEDRAFT_201468 [Capitella teleta]
METTILPSATTTEPESSGFSVLHITLVHILYFLCFLVILSNLLIIIAWLKVTDIRDIFPPSVAALACADFSVGVFTLFFIICESISIYGSEYHAIEQVKNVARFCTSVSTFASVLSLIQIAVDRCVSVLHPLRYEQIMTTRVYIIINIMMWLASCCLTLLNRGYVKYLVLSRKLFCLALIIVYLCLAVLMITFHLYVGVIACMQARKINPSEGFVCVEYNITI